jgi:anti-sigma-K factor RskA
MNDAGAYVLGALDPEERASYAEHLRTCEHCQSDVAELQVVADVLPNAAPQVAPPPEVKARIMTVVEADAARRGNHAQPGPATSRAARWRRGRPLRPALAAGLACALLAAGVGVGIAISGGSSMNVETVAAVVDHAAAPGANVTFVCRGDEGRLVMSRMPVPPDGKIYQVWLQRKGKAPEPTNHLFSVRPQGTTVEAIAGNLRGVQRVLVTAEPRGGSEAPTSRPVIVATPS